MPESHPGRLSASWSSPWAAAAICSSPSPSGPPWSGRSDSPWRKCQMLRISYEAVCTPEASPGEYRRQKPGPAAYAHRGPLFRGPAVPVQHTGRGAPQLYSTLTAASTRELFELHRQPLPTALWCARPAWAGAGPTSPPWPLPDGILCIWRRCGISPASLRTRGDSFPFYRWILLIRRGARSAVLFLLSILAHYAHPHLGKGHRPSCPGDYTPPARRCTADEHHEAGGELQPHGGRHMKRLSRSWEDAAPGRRILPPASSTSLKTPLTSIIGYAELLRSRQW